MRTAKKLPLAKRPPGPLSFAPITFTRLATDLHHRWTIADVFGIIGIVFFALYYLTAFRFDTLFTVPSRQVDFSIWQFAPSYILEHLRYPAVVTGDWEHAVFPYLPSAAVMMLPLSWPPQPIAFAIWLLIEAAAFAIVLWAGLRLSGAMPLRARWLIALAAVLLSESSLGWDFRNHNNNIVYLALVMLGLLASKTWLSALLIALSTNLKLYSAFIPFVLVWRGEYRLAVATIILTGLIAIFLPAVVFGPSAYPQLMADWVAQIRYTVVVHSGGTPSLIRSVATLLGEDPAASSVNVALRATQAAWLALVGCYYIFAARAQPHDGTRYHQARLADTCVALMAPLPLSTWFLPYHAIVMLPAYLLLLTIAVGNNWPRWLRATAIGACIACQIVRFSVRDWDYRATVYLVSFVFLLLALAAVRKVLTTTDSEDEGVIPFSI